MELALVLFYVALFAVGIYLGRLLIGAIFGQPNRTPRHAKQRSPRTKW